MADLVRKEENTIEKEPPKKRSSPWKFTPEFIAPLAVKLTEWMAVKENWWLGDFAFDNGFNRHRMVEFAEENAEFAKVFEIAKQWQENKLAKMGISKNFNTSMAIFALKNVAGWRDITDLGLGSTTPIILNVVYDKPKSGPDDSPKMAE